MTQKTEDILAETKILFEELEDDYLVKKYDHFSKAVSAANYIFFVTIIWKSFDLSGDIPILAKLSLLFFGAGIIFSALKSFADYISDSFTNLTSYRRLIEIEDQYGEDLKKIDDEVLIHLKITNVVFRKILKNDDGNDLLKIVVFFCLSFVSLLISFLLLFLGVSLLTLSIFIY